MRQIPYSSQPGATSAEMIGDDFSPADARNGPFRTGQQRRDFNRCRGSGAAKGDDDLESDSDVWIFVVETAVKGGLRYLKVGICVGDGNWIKWFKLRGSKC